MIRNHINIILTALYVMYCVFTNTAHAQIVYEDRIWSYMTDTRACINNRNHVFDFSFMGTENINGKTYHYLVAPDWRDNINSATTFSIGRHLFHNVEFLRVPGEIDDTGSWSKFFLMREEDGKVYVYNDKNLKYTEPFVKENTTGIFDISLQTDDFPDEILIYDFNAQPGDRYPSWIFNYIGKPVPCVVEVISPLTNLKICDPDGKWEEERLILPWVGYLGCFLFGDCSSSVWGDMVRIYTIRGELRFSSDYDEFDITSSDYYKFHRLSSKTLKKYSYEYYSYSEDEGKHELSTYKMLPSDINSGYTSLTKSNTIRWYDDESRNWEMDNMLKSELEFRKDNGVVYVKPNLEWIDAETGLPFPEGTELIFSNLNVPEDAMFPTFDVENNIVTRQEKKVYAWTCALLPNKKTSDAWVFCDENGEVDQTMRYIDGIGFYGPEAGVTVFNGGKLNNIYDADGHVLIEGENVKIPEYVGVNEVGVGKVPDVIYTIEGLRVNGSVSDLPAGLYIVNGKKVAITR